MSLNEPSMEDILASIRRIIAEDQSNSLGRNALGGLTRRPVPPSPTPAPEAAPATDVGEHTGGPDEQAEHQEASPELSPHVYAEQTADMVSSLDHGEAPVHAEPAYAVEETYAGVAAPDHAAPIDHVPAAVLDSAMTAEEGEPLMSPFAGSSISSSFQTLAETVMLQDPGLIERVMRESMRPLLKAWLDDHLPSIVERLVRNEIERVARGGRGRNA